MRSATAAPYPFRPFVLRLAAVLAVALPLAAVPARAASVFLIRGGGDGHGVGMSQYGAYGYALHGKSYRWILGHYYQGTKVASTNPRRVVRVLIASGGREQSFSGATRAAGKRLKPSITYTVRPNADGTLTLIGPKGRKLATVAAPLTATGAGPVRLAGSGQYRGALEFRPDGSGGVDAINSVGLDDYVRGVVAAEMPATWAPQALEVQAVAARTYAITSDVGGNGFQLYPDTRSQMYEGVAAETPSTDAAVAATRGQIVTYHGVPAITYFSSSSGGHTENVEIGMPGATPEPWLRGVPDPYDGAGGDPFHRWGAQMSLARARAKLGSLVKGTLIGIEITAHGSSPRIITAQVIGTGGATTVTGLQLQQAFGLLTTYAAFTTITTLPGKAPLRVSPVSGGGATQTQGVAALVPLVEALLGSVPGVHGSVFPSRGGTQVAIQRQSHRSWRTVLHIRLAAGGGYDTALPGPGTYRIQVGSLTGPAVTVR